MHDDVIKWKHFPRYWPFVRERPVTRSFDVSFDLRLNKRLRKQSWGWWFETPSWSLWRQCNESPQNGHVMWPIMSESMTPQWRSRDQTYLQTCRMGWRRFYVLFDLSFRKSNVYKDMHWTIFCFEWDDLVRSFSFIKGLQNITVSDTDPQKVIFAT